MNATLGRLKGLVEAHHRTNLRQGNVERANGN